MITKYILISFALFKSPSSLNMSQCKYFIFKKQLVCIIRQVILAWYHILTLNIYYISIYIWLNLFFCILDTTFFILLRQKNYYIIIVLMKLNNVKQTTVFTNNENVMKSKPLYHLCSESNVIRLNLPNLTLGNFLTIISQSAKWFLQLMHQHFSTSLVS